MVLYEYYRSSASYRVRIALRLKSVTFESFHIHLLEGGGQHKQHSFLEKNTMGQVPTLDVDNNYISQSVAIIEYLNEIVPAPPLLPNTPIERAKVRDIVEAINSGIHPIQNLAVMKKLGQQFNISKDEMWAWARYWIQQGFLGLEKKLEPMHRTFCFGDQITMADLFLIPQVYNARRFGLDLEPFPVISKIEENCLRLDVFNKSTPENHPNFQP